MVFFFQVIMLCHWICLYMYVLFAYFTYLCFNLFWVPGAVGYNCLICIFFVYLIIILTLRMLNGGIIWVSSIFVYYMLTSSFTGLWLICPDLVLVSPFTGLGLLFMVMFTSVLLEVMQSSLSLDPICLKLAFCFCWIGVPWLLPSPVIIWYITMIHKCTHMWCLWSNHSVMFCWYCRHENVPLIIQFLCLSLPRGTGLQSLGCGICALCSALSVCPFSSLWLCRISHSGHCC